MLVLSVSVNVMRHVTLFDVVVSLLLLVPNLS